MAIGNKCNHLIIGFGKKVHSKLATDPKGRHKMDTEWGIGYFLCVTDRNTEYIMFMNGQLYTCTIVKPMADDEAYDPSMIEDATKCYNDFVNDGAETNSSLSVWLLRAMEEFPTQIQCRQRREASHRAESTFGRRT